MQWERIVEVARRWWADHRQPAIRWYVRRVPTPWRFALRRPTAKQREAYGRLLHTLSAASLTGAAVILGTAWPYRLWDVVRLLILTALGVWLFLHGAVMSKGER